MNVCVFCGSNAGKDPAYAAAAKEAAEALAEAGAGIVYGGASVGLMRIVADAGVAAGARVTGIIPKIVADLEVAHSGLTELVRVDSMEERKRLMIDRSDAFLVLPGGQGTLDEWFEVTTLAQLGQHAKPLAVANVNGYYDSLLAYLDRAVADGFVPKKELDRIGVFPDARGAVTHLLSRR